MNFQQGRLTLGKLCIGPRKVPPGHPWWIWFIKCPGLICLTRWSGPAPRRIDFRPVWIISFEFVKVCGIRFSSWKSFIDFYIWYYCISTILTCLFTVGIRISWEKVVVGRKHGGRDAISCLLPCVLYCMEGEFEQVIMKLRLIIKYNNN